MVGAGIVEVDCAFDEPQPEQADIKVQVGLRIARYRGDVMKFADRNAHTVWILKTRNGRR
jgi:hypothetical protein